MNVERLNLITYISLIIIVIAFFFCLFYVSRQRKTGALIAKRRWIEQLPSMISTLGVLGTFAGITIGLLYFDTEDLDASIPILLSGTSSPPIAVGNCLRSLSRTSVTIAFASALLLRVLPKS